MLLYKESLQILTKLRKKSEQLKKLTTFFQNSLLIGKNFVILQPTEPATVWQGGSKTLMESRG